MREVIVLGSLLAVSLVGAFFTWTAEEPLPNAEDRIDMFAASSGEVTGIAWKSDTLTVQVEKRSDALGEYSWITVTEPKQGKIRPPGDTDSEPEEEAKVTSFKGNDDAEEIWRLFSPLRAMRELSAADSAVYKLDQPLATIELTRASGVLSLPVGAETYGGKDRYVGLGDKVFLVDDVDLKPLQFGKSRLMERRLQPVAVEEADVVRVAQGETNVPFTHKNRSDAEADFWSRGGTDTPDAAASAWLTKLFKLRVQAYVEESELPETELVLSYEVEGQGKTWKVEILKENKPERPDFFAKTPFNRGAVKLTRSMANDMIADAPAVLAGTAPAPEKPAPKEPGAGPTPGAPHAPHPTPPPGHP